ncbi:Tma64p [Sugiyamaella lignohabitans]|uniref:Tma64p n=1 Tax=Sugiyamaella lignohabitans TaxID=796027 RepID=A0A167EC11_9ASCO|nr:Tma64p [Sugiyamaella lignohabitans]ANB13889.1 Tma64p [Sugiyamaella lignohabitans]
MQVHSGEKAVLYTDNDGQPVWIALEDGYLIPTLYTAWNAPFLMQRVCTVKYTLERLQSGADLMIPGIFDPLPENVPPGTVVSISLIDSPNIAVAVGIALVDCSRGKLDTNQKGKAVQLINVIDDKLFQLYRKKVPVPIELDVSVPLLETQDTPGDAENDPVTDKSKISAEGQDSIVNHTAESNVIENVNNGSSKETSQVEEITDTTENINLGENQPETETDGPENDTNSPSTAEIDDAFRRALLQTLRKAVDSPIEVPIPSSTFLSNYVLLNLPYNHPSVQMKKTSWKKASKFFKVMEKQSLLKGKERGGEFVITSLAGKNNTEVSSFTLFKPRPFEQHKPAASGSGTTSSNKKTYLSAKEYFKPRSMTAPIFEFSKLDPSKYYTADTIRQTLNNYITGNSLSDPKNPKNVKLDRPLTKALGLSPTIESIGRDKISSLLQSNCSQFHHITSQNDEDLNRQTATTLAKGPIPRITITTEKRAGRKVVTNVTNIEPFHLDPIAFAEELRVACAGSTSVNAIKEGSDLQQVMIQGHHVAAITKTLELKGIRPAWIDVVDKARR